MPRDAKDEMLRLRGARSFMQGRFETRAREPFDDGWTAEEKAAGALEATVTVERARSILSTNDSPDVGFDRSVNPYRGCEHGCIYCLAGDTPILMADGGTRQLATLRPGDEIIGTRREGWYRRYVRSRVKAHWYTVKPAYRVTLEDGTELIASGDHRFLTGRGWKYVQGKAQGGERRPHLTRGSKLMGTGRFAQSVSKGADYRRGYLCGLIRGDGLLASYEYIRAGRAHGNQHQFRLALCDVEPLIRTQDYLRQLQVETQHFIFAEARVGRRLMHAIRTHARPSVETIRDVIAWPDGDPSVAWSAGFLAGIFDAEGSYSEGVLRISNTDRRIIESICRSLQQHGLAHTIDESRGGGGRVRKLYAVRLTGGLQEHMRFFHTTDPSVVRKRSIVGQAVKSSAKLGVAGVEPLGRAMQLYDITTETGDFIANGVVSHNCYARPSHSYLELSPGLDFETRLFAKTNAAELLRETLAKPGYRPAAIALGANTDCYQPIERKYRITRGILELLAACEHPLTLVTKSALVERDLDLLAPMARKNLVKVFVSIGTLDRELARKLEPRAASPQRRLDVLKALRGAGVPCGVMVAALIPALNDKTLEAVLEAAAAAGAAEAAYVILRLPNELKQLFREWLDAHYPERAEHVISIVRQMRGGKDNDPRFGARMTGMGQYAELIEKRFDIACRRYGLNGHGGPRRPAELDCSRFRPPALSGQMALF